MVFIAFLKMNKTSRFHLEKTLFVLLIFFNKYSIY
jgi:hypothetical protein